MYLLLLLGAQGSEWFWNKPTVTKTHGPSSLPAPSKIRSHPSTLFETYTSSRKDAQTYPYPQLYPLCSARILPPAFFLSTRTGLVGVAIVYREKQNSE